jgi:hypothetical protein
MDNLIMLVVINFGPYVECQVVWIVVEILLTKFHHICIHVQRVMANLVHLGLLWKQLGRTSVTEFFEHGNIGNWLGVEYQHWSLWNPTSTDQKWEFLRYISRDLWIFAYDGCDVRFQNIYHEWVFVVHILLVNIYEQAYEYVFNQNSIFQMVRLTRSVTPQIFEH